MSTQQDTSFFVIAHRDREELDSPVFHAGPEREEEAIAVFSNPEHAQQYIAKAGLSVDCEVGELRPLQVLKWFQTAKGDGVELVAVNPDPSWATFSSREDVISLDDPEQAFSILTQAQATGDEK